VSVEHNAFQTLVLTDFTQWLAVNCVVYRVVGLVTCVCGCLHVIPLWQIW